MNVSFEAPNLDYEAAIRFTNQTYDRNFSYPSFAITLRRKASRYFYTKILPTGMLVAISWVNRCHQMSFLNFLTAVDKFHSLQISSKEMADSNELYGENSTVGIKLEKLEDVLEPNQQQSAAITMGAPDNSAGQSLAVVKLEPSTEEVSKPDAKMVLSKILQRSI